MLPPPASPSVQATDTNLSCAGVVLVKPSALCRTGRVCGRVWCARDAMGALTCGLPWWSGHRRCHDTICKPNQRGEHTICKAGCTERGAGRSSAENAVFSRRHFCKTGFSANNPRYFRRFCKSDFRPVPKPSLLVVGAICIIDRHARVRDRPGICN